MLCLVVILFRAPLTGFLLRAAEPFAYVGSGIKGIFGFGSTVFSSKAILVKENADLKMQLASTSAAVADRAALAAQNEHLLAQLGRIVAGKTVIAGVLMRPPATPYDTLLLDAGTREGVTEGATVLSGASAIGLVKDVYDTTSRVVLFSSPGNEFQSLLNVTTPVAMQGVGAGSIMGQVPAGVSVKVGDPVSLLGVGGSFGGSVSHISMQEGASFKTIYVQLAKSVFELTFVTIRL